MLPSDLKHPSEFVSFLQERFAEFGARTPRASKFNKITKQQIEKAGGIWPKGDPLDGLVRKTASDLVAVLSPKERSHFEAVVACGKINSHDFNAQIMKSPQGFYAITLFEGLMMLFNKFAKLTWAAKHPEDVTYCNRGNPKEIAASDYRQMMAELFESYKTTRIPVGPLLKGNDRFTKRQAETVLFAEAFVIAHEMGHFFNGDLNSDLSFKPLSIQPAVKFFQNNKNHKMEFAADLAGFRIYARFLRKNHPAVEVGEALFPVILTFDAMAAISDTETYSHPDPLTRLFHIVLFFFGEEAANALSKTYTEEGAERQYFDLCRTLSLETACKK